MSDFSHKSLNASEESRIVVNPDGLERVDELRIWYEEVCTAGVEKVDLHALSGSLNVETHGLSKDAEMAMDRSEINIMDFLKRGGGGDERLGRDKRSENPEDESIYHNYNRESSSSADDEGAAGYKPKLARQQ